MKILIKKNAYIYANSDKSREWLKENEGKWVEVETDHLFTNQYNTSNMRVLDSQVEAVSDDARIGKGKCKYCGSVLNEGEVCTKYLLPNQFGDKCSDYGIEWFTPKNTYFLRYPNGIKNIQVENVQLHSIKFGTYYFYTGMIESLGCYRLSNARQTINFKYDGNMFEIHNGIGYKSVKNLPIPAKAMEELKKWFKNNSK